MKTSGGIISFVLFAGITANCMHAKENKNLLKSKPEDPKIEGVIISTEINNEKSKISNEKSKIGESFFIPTPALTEEEKIHKSTDSLLSPEYSYSAIYELKNGFCDVKINIFGSNEKAVEYFDSYLRSLEDVKKFRFGDTYYRIDSEESMVWIWVSGDKVVSVIWPNIFGKSLEISDFVERFRKKHTSKSESDQRVNSSESE